MIIKNLSVLPDRIRSSEEPEVWNLVALPALGRLWEKVSSGDKVEP